MEPVALLTFGNEISQVLSIRSIVPGLCDHIDEEIPRSRLSHLRQRARDRLLLFCRCSNRASRPLRTSRAAMARVMSVCVTGP